MGEMMEAKDTLMGLEKRLARAIDLQMVALLNSNDDMVKALTKHLEAQTEITWPIAFKAGYDQALKDNGVK